MKTLYFLGTSNAWNFISVQSASTQSKQMAHGKGFLFFFLESRIQHFGPIWEILTQYDTAYKLEKY